MQKRSRDRQSQPQWLTLAEPYDHHLNSENPLWVGTGEPGPATRLEVHVHKGMDVGIVVSGEEHLYFGDVRLALRPGDVWLCAMWEPHAWQFMEPDSSSTVVCFLPDVLEHSLEQDPLLLSMFTVPPSERPNVTTPDMRVQMLTWGQEIAREYSDQRPGWRTMVWLALVRILVTLRRVWTPPPSSAIPAVINANYMQRIAPALSLVHSNLQRRVGARDAAKPCGLSVSRFHQLFRQVMGLSYSEFYLRARLAFAAHQLLSTELSIETIALEAGFVDGSHLHRRFLACYGQSPGEYRRKGQLTPAPDLRSSAERRQ